MNISRTVFRRETFVPLLAMIFASAVCVGLVLARIVWTGKFRYSFLGWNLFLAWLPLVFAWLACVQFRPGQRPTTRFLTVCGAWLLFFPNAPYIFTDLVHLTNRYFAHFWVDLGIVLSCAFTGLMLGFLSLYLMHGLVTRQWGWAAGWLFVAGAAGLCSFGVYLGRFLRFNSWDVIAKPVELAQGITATARGHAADAQHFAFLVLFATFVFIAYVMLYALTHLPRMQTGAPIGPESEA